MVYRTYQCTVCKDNIEVRFNSVHDAVSQTYQTNCSVCEETQKFVRLFEAPYHTFGMLSQRYSGQIAAVKGYGTHQLDYDVGDLARRRAVDATQEFNSRAGLDHVNVALNQAIKNEKQAVSDAKNR